MRDSTKNLIRVLETAIAANDGQDLPIGLISLDEVKQGEYGYSADLVSVHTEDEGGRTTVILTYN